MRRAHKTLKMLKLVEFTTYYKMMDAAQHKLAVATDRLRNWLVEELDNKFSDDAGSVVTSWIALAGAMTD